MGKVKTEKAKENSNVCKRDDIGIGITLIMSIITVIFFIGLTIFDIVHNNEIMKTQIKCQDGWNGLRKLIIGTMGRDSCWTFWGDSQFGNQEIIPLHRISA